MDLFIDSVLVWKQRLESLQQYFEWSQCLESLVIDAIRINSLESLVYMANTKPSKQHHRRW